MLSRGTRASDMAINAPIIEVLGVNPSREMICIQTIADNADTIIESTSVAGSNAFTWSDSSFSAILFLLNSGFPAILFSGQGLARSGGFVRTYEPYRAPFRAPLFVF
jgi:hypothetical protein